MMTFRTRWIAMMLLSLPALAVAQNSSAVEWAMRPTTPTVRQEAATMSIYEIPVQPMEADEHTSPTLGPYRGKVMLIVNVASRCGLTPQYEGLQALYERHKDEGLVVLGFPCNQFREQEPGTEAEILQFCQANYGVTFPIYAKIDVNGKNRAPLYRHLAGEGSPFPGDITWNFEKFLIGRDGRIIARFEPRTTPDSEEVLEAVRNALAEAAPSGTPEDRLPEAGQRPGISRARAVARCAADVISPQRCALIQSGLTTHVPPTATTLGCFR